GVGHHREEVRCHARLPRLSLQLAAQAAGAQEDELERWRTDQSQRLDEPGQVLLLLEAAHVQYGALPRGGPGFLPWREAVRIHTVGEVGEPRLARVGGQQGLHLARRHDHTRRPGEGRALEPVVEPRLEPRPGDPRHLGVVIAVGDDERSSIEPSRDESRHDTGELLDPKRLALAELAAVEEGQEEGVRARGPPSALGQEHDLVEKEWIPGEVGERCPKVAHVVDAVVALAVVSHIVVEQPLVLAGALEIREPAAEGRQDADRAEWAILDHRLDVFSAIDPYARRRSSTMRSPLNFALTISAARRPSARRSSGSASSSSIARARASGSLRSTRSPVDLSSTASGVPPILVPITGLANAAASSGTRLKGS